MKAKYFYYFFGFVFMFLIIGFFHMDKRSLTSAKYSFEDPLFLAKEACSFAGQWRKGDIKEYIATMRHNHVLVGLEYFCRDIKHEKFDLSLCQSYRKTFYPKDKGSNDFLEEYKSLINCE